MLITGGGRPKPKKSGCMSNLRLFIWILLYLIFGTVKDTDNIYYSTKIKSVGCV